MNTEFRYVGLILAAGKSHRYGKNKLAENVPNRSISIIENLVQSFLDSHISNIVVVVSSKYENDIREILSNYDIKFVSNPHPEKGMSSSVKIGIKEIQHTFDSMHSFDYLILTPADYPFYSAQLIKKILTKLQQRKPGIAIPSFDHKRGHPLLVHQKYIKELLNIKESSKGLKGFLKSYKDQITYIEVDDPSILKDVDYPTDLNRKKSKHTV